MAVGVSLIVFAIVQLVITGIAVVFNQEALPGFDFIGNLFLVIASHTQWLGAHGVSDMISAFTMLGKSSLTTETVQMKLFHIKALDDLCR
jgi:hypothetical protein